MNNISCKTECSFSRNSVLSQVEAAVRNGTHYCDIAGEVHFLRKTIEKLHAEAHVKKVKIVHSCGFDSVPSDLGAHMLVEVWPYLWFALSLDCLLYTSPSPRD